MNMAITPLYAALLAALFVILSLRVILLRRTAGVGLGDGGNAQLLRRQRVHANFAEYAPFTLLLMALAEWQGAPGWSLHLLGLLLTAGRLLHALGVSRTPERYGLRVTAMSLTFAALSLGALANLLLTL